MAKPSEDKTMASEPIARRIAIERKIDLRFPTFEGLASGVSANLSTTGMFIRSNEPESPGTEFTFAFRIEEWSPIQGTGRVIWTRKFSEGPERPAGMGVKFVDLDAQSRRMIRYLVDKHVQEGGKLFDLDTVPAGASKYKGSTRGQGKRSGGIDRQAAPGRAKIPWLIGIGAAVALAVAAIGVYLDWFDFTSGTQRVGAGASREGLSGPQDAESPEAAQGVGPDQGAADPMKGVTIEEVTAFIRSWTDAWEARDADAVLGHYADDFAPEDGGRQRWESEIRRRVAGAEHIRLAVSALEVSFPTSGLAQVSFFRSFRSHDRDESGRMLLELEPTDSGWKIRREESID